MLRHAAFWTWCGENAKEKREKKYVKTTNAAFCICAQSGKCTGGNWVENINIALRRRPMKKWAIFVNIDWGMVDWLFLCAADAFPLCYRSSSALLLPSPSSLLFNLSFPSSIRLNLIRIISMRCAWCVSNIHSIFLARWLLGVCQQTAYLGRCDNVPICDCNYMHFKFNPCKPRCCMQCNRAATYNKIGHGKRNAWILKWM